MKNKELEEAAKKSFGEIWASLTTEQSEYLKGYIDRQIDMAKRRQAERMYSEEEVEKITKELFFTMANCDKRIIHKESDFNKWLVEQFKKK